MRLALWALAAVAVAGCSVSFDPSGQPCDAKGGCLAGYVCDATRHCITASGTSAGGSSGSSGTSGSGSLCGGVACGVEQECSTDGGVARCIDRSGPGVLCGSPADCAGGLCLARPGAQLGICARACTPGADAGCPAGSTCSAVTGARGDSFHLCLDAPPPVSCARQSDCGAGAVDCVPFDDVSPSGSAVDGELPALFCDAVRADAGADGASCLSDSSCRSGLCAAVGTAGSCVEACGGSGCPSGMSCSAVRDVELGRVVLGCVGAATGCHACDGGCGPDAPDCDATRNVCVLDCTSSDIDPCGASRSCIFGQSGLASCAVNGAACP